jgi:hypothetical protein
MTETMTPPYDRARETLHPVVEYVREGAAAARVRRSRRRARAVLVGVSLAVAGAAGVAGLRAARRNRPERIGGEPADLDRVATTDSGLAGEDPTIYRAPSRLTTAAHRMTEGTARVADTVAVGADKLAHVLHDRALTDGRHRSAEG